MSGNLVISNARIVLPDRILNGSVHIDNGIIASIDGTPSHAPGAIDLDGRYLLPGLVELHTDNIEKHYAPRPGVTWPMAAALFAHDSAIVAAGITTVFNAVATGDIIGTASRIENFHRVVEAVHAAERSGKARARHFLHIRCEVTCEPTLENVERVIDADLVRLVSLMDHSPGQRQFTNIDKYREYFQGKYQLDTVQVQALIDRQTEGSLRFGKRQRSAIRDLCRERRIPLASHDDATDAHVQEAVDDGVTIAEFPTTLAAARACRMHGLHILMGAPNVVRGGSHSGNVSARDLADIDLLDSLSSDYVPASSLHAAFLLAGDDETRLPSAVRRISLAPARATGLSDRGSIENGKLADLIDVDLLDGTPIVRQVWRGGTRVL